MEKNSYLCRPMTAMILSILPAMVCGVLTALLALDLCREFSRARLYLLFFMVAAGLLYIGHGVYFTHQTEVIPVTDTIYSFCNPAVFPLFYIYIEELTTGRHNRWRHVLYLLPSLCCMTAVGVFYSTMNPDEIAVFTQQYLYNGDHSMLSGYAWWQAMTHQSIKVVFALQIPFVFISGWHKITRFNRQIEENYSSTENKMLTTLKPLLLVFAVASVASFVSNIIGRQNFADSIEMLAVPSVSFSILLLLIGHAGIHQFFTAKELEEDICQPEDTTKEKEAESGSVVDTIGEEIIHVVDGEHLYLQPNLKINDLAQRLNTNREYIYRAINIGMGQSFADFINSRRIDYAAGLLEDNPQMPLTEVAHKAGFSSPSAFYRNWKRFKDYPPKVWGEVK
jgi:AraC-like DNA-binding protein